MEHPKDNGVRIDDIYDMMEGVEDMHEDDFVPPSAIHKSIEHPDLKSRLLSLAALEV